MQRHQIQRHRHETRRRQLIVSSIEPITKHMLRMNFTCSDLHDFTSVSADDHIKLFFPTGDRPGARPCMRDFTPRRFDTENGILTIDFALHDEGPATDWATGATVGDPLEIGGPRGSMVIPDDFDWYVLIGDETALPAIGRRLEELRGGVPVTSIVLLDDPADAQTIKTAARWTPEWLVREDGVDDRVVLTRALATLTLPEGEGFIWIAGETSLARTARSHVIDTLGQPREYTKAAGYWTKGHADAHERIED